MQFGYPLQYLCSPKLPHHHAWSVTNSYPLLTLIFNLVNLYYLSFLLNPQPQKPMLQLYLLYFLSHLLHQINQHTQVGFAILLIYCSLCWWGFNHAFFFLRKIIEDDLLLFLLMHRPILFFIIISIANSFIFLGVVIVCSPSKSHTKSDTHLFYW